MPRDLYLATIVAVHLVIVLVDMLSTAMMVLYSILRDLDTWKGTEFTKTKSIDSVACRIFLNKLGGIVESVVLGTGWGLRRLVFPCKAGTAGPKIAYARLISSTETGELCKVLLVTIFSCSFCVGQPRIFI